MLVELNHELSADTLYWPDKDGFPFKLSIKTTNFPGGRAACGKIYSQEHIGTHLDAPWHMASNGWTLDEIPPERLIAPAVVIDVREKVRQCPWYGVTADDIAKSRKEHGEFPNNCVVLMLTGWSNRFGDKAAYFGDNGTDYSKFVFPGIDPSAASAILQLKETHNINVVGVGIDTPSVDSSKQLEKFPAHTKLSSANLYIIENLTNLEKIPSRGVETIVMPLKIKGGTGSSCRVLARWE